MSDLKRFFSIDVIIVGILCLLVLIVLIISGSYLSAMLVLATILCAAIARSYEITVEDSEAVIIQMSEKISELETKIAQLLKENADQDSVNRTLEWHREAEKTNSTRTITQLKEEIEHLSAELEKAKAGDAQDSKKKPGRKKKLDLSDKDVTRIKTELRSAGLTKDEK